MSSTYSDSGNESFSSRIEASRLLFTICHGYSQLNQLSIQLREQFQVAKPVDELLQYFNLYYLLYAQPAIEATIATLHSGNTAISRHVERITPKLQNPRSLPRRYLSIIWQNNETTVTAYFDDTKPVRQFISLHASNPKFDFTIPSTQLEVKIGNNEGFRYVLHLVSRAAENHLKTVPHQDFSHDVDSAIVHPNFPGIPMLIGQLQIDPSTVDWGILQEFADKALEELRLLYKAFEKIPEISNHPQAVAIYSVFSSAFHLLGQSDVGQTMLKYGAIVNAPEVVSNYINHQQLNDGVVFAEEILDMALEVLPPNDKRWTSVYATLGDAYLANKDHLQASSAYRKAYEIPVYSHMLTTALCTRYAQSVRMCGDPMTAKKIIEQGVYSNSVNKNEFTLQCEWILTSAMSGNSDAALARTLTVLHAIATNRNGIGAPLGVLLGELRYVSRQLLDQGLNEIPKAIINFFVSHLASYSSLFWTSQEQAMLAETTTAMIVDMPLDGNKDFAEAALARLSSLSKPAITEAVHSATVLLPIPETSL